MFEEILPGLNFQIQIWAAGVVFLFFKMMSNTAVQGYARMNGGKLAVAEDYKTFSNCTVPIAPRESDLLDRASACWRNDLENIPMFLILGLGYILAGADSTLLKATIAIFCLARVMHTVAYLRKMQPMRTIAYGIGALASFTIAIALLVRMLDNLN